MYLIQKSFFRLCLCFHENTDGRRTLFYFLELKDIPTFWWYFLVCMEQTNKVKTILELEVTRQTM